MTNDEFTELIKPSIAGLNDYQKNMLIHIAKSLAVYTEHHKSQKVTPIQMAKGYRSSLD